MTKKLSDMSEEELRDELMRIRSERLGKGRQKRREAKTKRTGEHATRKKREKAIREEEEAEFV